MTFLRRRLNAVTTHQVGQDLLLLDIESDRIHQLNQTASFIWQKCDEAASAEDIVRSLAAVFDVEERVARQDVTETLTRLRALKLVVAPCSG